MKWHDYLDYYGGHKDASSLYHNPETKDNVAVTYKPKKASDNADRPRRIRSKD